jgi:hypothetical protein
MCKYKIGRILKYRHTDGTDRQVVVYYSNTIYSTYEEAQKEIYVIMHTNLFDYCIGWTVFKINEEKNENYL